MGKIPPVSAALIALGAAILVASPVRAQDHDSDDPPARAARLSWIDGNVSFQPGGIEDWVPATLNRPLTTGDRLWTDVGGRAELVIGSAAFRLGAKTNFTFLNLSDGAAQVQLSSGTLSVRVRSVAEGENIEIDTPQAAFSLLRPGEYRIDVSDAGDTTIGTARSGESEVIAGGQEIRIGAREQVRISDRNGWPSFERRAAPVADVFDNWCQERDRREDRSESGRHVSHDIPGYADLDEYGVWREDLQYAWIWMPRVTPGWAPYRYGHWVWIEPWGWTWVDDAPWGYAPFHYGRWISIRGGWGWVPGPFVARPVFCPALVAWVGGPGFSIGVSIGGPTVGWFPLGPREVWRPPYRHSPRYMERVNVTNTVIVNRTVINNYDARTANYMNRGIPGAVTAVPGDVLAAGRPVGSAALRVPPETAGRAPIREFAEVAPQRESLLGGRMPAGIAPPREVTNRRVVAVAAPPAAPVPFTERQRALQSNPGRPLDRGTMEQLRQRQPAAARPAVRQATPQTPQPEQRPPLSQPAPGQTTQPGARLPREAGQSERSNRQGRLEPQPAPQPEARPQRLPDSQRPRPQAAPPPQPPAQRTPQAPPPQPRAQPPVPQQRVPQASPRAQPPSQAPVPQAQPQAAPPARRARPAPRQDDSQPSNPPARGESRR